MRKYCMAYSYATMKHMSQNQGLWCGPNVACHVNTYGMMLAWKVYWNRFLLLHSVYWP